VRTTTIVGLAGLLRVVIVDEFLAVLNAMRIQVADRHDLCAVVGQQARHIVTARNAPGADAAYVDALARRKLPEHRGRHDCGEPHRSRGAQPRLQKIAP
jgi:hypothetical protein